MRRTFKRNVPGFSRNSPRGSAKDRGASETQWVWAGDASPSVLVAGHSHRGSYSAAIADGVATGVAVLVPGGSFDPSAVPQPDATYWRTACSTPGRVLAVVWNGNQHNRHFTFAFDPPLQLHDSGELERLCRPR